MNSTHTALNMLYMHLFLTLTGNIISENFGNFLIGILDCCLDKMGTTMQISQKTYALDIICTELAHRLIDTKLAINLDACTVKMIRVSKEAVQIADSTNTVQPGKNKKWTDPQKSLLMNVVKELKVSRKSVGHCWVLVSACMKLYNIQATNEQCRLQVSAIIFSITVFLRNKINLE